MAPTTRVLILGSLPGAASLSAGQYYAHPRNQFWALAGDLIGRTDLPALPYTARLPVLLAAGIGLWDTIASAQRTGSLDSAIRQAEAAPLAKLVSALPDLRCVAFNGAKAAGSGRKALAASGLTLIDLPSSSPALAALSLAQKRSRWLELKHFLG